MKKLCLMVLSLLLILLFASCQQNPPTTTKTTEAAPDVTTEAVITTTPLDGTDPVAAYEYVASKMNALGGYEVISVEEQNLGYGSHVQEMLIKVNLLDGKKGFISTKVDDEMTGVNYTVDMTYIDGTVYCLMKTQGVSVKYKTKEASVTAVFENFFDKEKTYLLKSLSFAPLDDGTYGFDIVLENEEALKLLLKSFEAQGYDASAFSDYSVTSKLVCGADGYPISSTDLLTFTMEGMACSVISETTYQNIGTVPEITLPADADSYVDADAAE